MHIYINFPDKIVGLVAIAFYTPLTPHCLEGDTTLHKIKLLFVTFPSPTYSKVNK